MGLSYGVDRAVGVVSGLLLLFGGELGAALCSLALFAGRVGVVFVSGCGAGVCVDLFLDLAVLFVRLVCLPPTVNILKSKHQHSQKDQGDRDRAHGVFLQPFNCSIGFAHCITFSKSAFTRLLL